MIAHISMLNVMVVLFYTVWGILSILPQSTNKLTDKIKSYDLLNILPNYKFFCPNPIRSDYHLYYRGRFQDDQFSQWEEIRIGHKVQLLCAIWNPHKRERKVFYKVVKIIRKHYRKRKGTHYGHAYLLLLDFIKNQGKMKGFNGIQFRISSRQDLEKLTKERIFFTSRIHEYETVAINS